ERVVTDAQARMPALLAVGAGATPVLLEEHREALDRALEVVFRVHGPQQLVGAHALVETAHDALEGRAPADLGPETRADDVAALAHPDLQVHDAPFGVLGVRGALGLAPCSTTGSGEVFGGRAPRIEPAPSKPVST